MCKAVLTRRVVLMLFLAVFLGGCDQRNQSDVAPQASVDPSTSESFEGDASLLDSPAVVTSDKSTPQSEPLIEEVASSAPTEDVTPPPSVEEMFASLPPLYSEQIEASLAEVVPCRFQEEALESIVAELSVMVSIHIDATTVSASDDDAPTNSELGRNPFRAPFAPGNDPFRTSSGPERDPFSASPPGPEPDAIEITCFNGQLPLRLFLDYLHVHYNIAWDVDDDSIILMRPNKFSRRCRTRVYDLSSLGEGAEIACTLMRAWIDPSDPILDNFLTPAPSEYCRLERSDESIILHIKAPRPILEKADEYLCECLCLITGDVEPSQADAVPWEAVLTKRIAFTEADFETLESVLAKLHNESSVPLMSCVMDSESWYDIRLRELQRISPVELSIRAVALYLFETEPIVVWNSPYSDDALWIIPNRLQSRGKLPKPFDDYTPTQIVLDVPRIHELSNWYVDSENGAPRGSVGYVAWRTQEIIGVHRTEGTETHGRHFMMASSPLQDHANVEEFIHSIQIVLDGNLCVECGEEDPLLARSVEYFHVMKSPGSVLQKLGAQLNTAVAFEPYLLRPSPSPMRDARISTVPGQKTVAEIVQRLELEYDLDIQVLPDLIIVEQSGGYLERQHPLYVYDVTNLLIIRNAFNRILVRDRMAEPMQLTYDEIRESRILPFEPPAHPTTGSSYENGTIKVEDCIQQHNVVYIDARAILLQRSIEPIHKLQLAKLDRLMGDREYASVRNPYQENGEMIDVPLLPSHEEVPPEMLRRLVLDLNQFTFDMSQELLPQATSDGNVFFSPYSVSIAMGMAYTGSRDETAEQIAAALHFSEGPERFWAVQTAFQNAMSQDFCSDVAVLDISNGMWIQNDYPIDEQYLSILKRGYRAELANVDFLQRDATAEIINRWTYQATQGRIPEIVSSDDFDELTRSVIANAVYFKGKWITPFEKDLTSSLPFHNFEGEGHVVDMMVQQTDYEYGESDGALILALPYEENGCRMIVVLPEEPGREAFETLEEKLDAAMFHRWMNSELGSALVDLWLPKFSLRTRYDLKPALLAMSMTDAFDPMAADFSGVSQEPELHIQWIRHKATLDVDEEGTVAAAVTAMGMGGYGGPPTYIPFHVDRPFLLFIEHEPSGAILFTGRVMKPEPLLQATHP